MNLFDLQPGAGDTRGIAAEGNSIDLPSNELLAAVGESSGNKILRTMTVSDRAGN